MALQEIIAAIDRRISILEEARNLLLVSCPTARPANTKPERGVAGRGRELVGRRSLGTSRSQRDAFQKTPRPRKASSAQSETAPVSEENLPPIHHKVAEAAIASPTNDVEANPEAAPAVIRQKLMPRSVRNLRPSRKPATLPISPFSLPTALSRRAPSGPVVVSAATVREELERKAQVKAPPAVGRPWSSTGFPFGALEERALPEPDAPFQQRD